MIELKKHLELITQAVQISTMHQMQEYLKIMHHHMTVQKQAMHSAEVIQVQN